jgi:bacillithiol system protein YtxJ
MLDWRLIENMSQVERIKEDSFRNIQLIFKHSTRCSISSTAKNRLERNWSFSEDQIVPHYLDLIQYRSISNHIVEAFGVPHESPQIILIKNGEAIYDASHFGIDANELKGILTY